MKLLNKSVKVIVNKNSESIILEGKGLRYELYFDKPYHTVFAGNPQSGSLINIGTPENPTGALKIEFYPVF